GGVVLARHVREVVAGAEYRTVSGQHHTHRVAFRRLAERGEELSHVLKRERVALARPVHRDRREVTAAGDLDAFIRHVATVLATTLPPWPPSRPSTPTAPPPGTSLPPRSAPQASWSA